MDAGCEAGVTLMSSGHRQGPCHYSLVKEWAATQERLETLTEARTQGGLRDKSGYSVSIHITMGGDCGVLEQG